MTRDEARALVIATIARVAPGADASAVAETADLRRELDLDSFDLLQLLTALSKAIGRDIPERDYPRLTTLQGAVDYLSRDETPQGG